MSSRVRDTFEEMYICLLGSQQSGHQILLSRLGLRLSLAIRSTPVFLKPSTWVNLSLHHMQALEDSGHLCSVRTAGPWGCPDILPPQL